MSTDERLMPDVLGDLHKKTTTPRLPAWVLWLASWTVACGGGGSTNGAAPMGAEQTDPSCTTQPLPFYVEDAEYSTTLERVVALSGYSVFLVDPTTAQSVQIALPNLARSLSLAPDGLTAAVSHDTSVSILDLQQQSVTATIPTSTTEAGDVVLASNGFAYVFPRRYDDGPGIHSIEIAASKDHGAPPNSFDRAARAKLHPDGKSLYAMLSVSPGALGHSDISGGVATGFREQLEHGDHVKGGDVWISPDGSDIFTGCGTVFHAAQNAADDMIYRAALSIVSTDERVPLFPSMAFDQLHDRVYAIVNEPAGFDGYMAHEGMFGTFGYQSLTTLSVKPVPCVAKGPSSEPAKGLFVFTSTDASKIFVLTLAQGQGGSLASALATFDP